MLLLGKRCCCSDGKTVMPGTECLWGYVTFEGDDDFDMGDVMFVMRDEPRTVCSGMGQYVDRDNLV